MSALKFLIPILRAERKWVAVFFLSGIIVGASFPISQTTFKFMLDSLVHSHKNTWFFAFLYMGIYFSELVLWRVQQYASYRSLPNIQAAATTSLFKMAHGNSYKFFQDRLSGAISGNVTFFSDSFYNSWWAALHLMRSCVFVIVTMASLMSTHIICFCILFFGVSAFTIVHLLFSKRIMELSDNVAASHATLTGEINDSIANEKNVRLFSGFSYEMAGIYKCLQKANAAYRAKEWFLIKFYSAQGICTAITFFAVIIFSIYLHGKKLITIGEFSSMFFLVGMTLLDVIWFTTDQLDRFRDGIGKCNQCVNAIENTGRPLRDGSRELFINGGAIEFKNISFRYSSDGPSVFDGLSISIRAGQKVGIVGYSGAGKTTLINLLLKLYCTESGSIAIDGQDISDVTYDSLYKSISVITQDTLVFHRSIMDNIRYGSFDASDAAVVKAAKKAHAHTFIANLSGGYNALVGDRGIKLSGGQRQRIGIARAILKDSPILVLDEATSSMDSLSEHLIQQSMTSIMDGKTCMVIAHRLSTLLQMDRIIVMGEGRIIEDGSHADLIALGGLYKKFWDTQIGGFFHDTLD